MKRYLLILVALLCFQNVKASPQSPDYLIYQNDTIPIFHRILEKYLQPIEHLESVELFRFDCQNTSSLNCWRGYQTVFILENDSLFLKYILPCGAFRYNFDSVAINDSNKRMKVLFQNQVVSNKVHVNWYSSIVAVPKGNLLRWDSFFAETYYKEEILKFKKGILKRKQLVDNYIDLPNGISRRLEELEYWPNNKPITDTVFALIKQLDWEKLSSRGYWCDNYYDIVIGKKGKIKDIEYLSSILGAESEKEFKKDQRTYRKCRKILKRSLKDLQFDIITWNGKPYQERIRFKIFYSDEKGLENWSD